MTNKSKPISASSELEGLALKLYIEAAYDDDWAAMLIAWSGVCSFGNSKEKENDDQSGNF